MLTEDELRKFNAPFLERETPPEGSGIDRLHWEYVRKQAEEWAKIAEIEQRGLTDE